jgi:glutathione S-transferase
MNTLSLPDLKMPTYKLYYFQGRGRAELIRWIFIQAGVPYEDIRFTQEEWAVFKPKTPYGGLPSLEIDGKIFGGSAPIERYIAEQHGLAGSNELENFELSTIFDVTFDLLLRVILHHFEKEEARKADLKKELEETHLPKYLGILNKVITDNGAADGWIYGNKVTYVDLRVAQLADLILLASPNALDAYPAVAKLKATVEALPKIAKWIKERPESEF